jgi:hypothetical protein
VANENTHHKNISIAISMKKISSTQYFQIVLGTTIFAYIVNYLFFNVIDIKQIARTGFIFSMLFYIFRYFINKK